MLVSMGFSEAKAKKALKNCGGNVERATDWIFSHADEPDDDDGDAAMPDAAAGAGSSGDDTKEDGLGRYVLRGFVSHVGRNLSSGHYVAHVKKNGQWCIFDDEKVAKSEEPPFQYGYLYMFQREDCVGKQGGFSPSARGAAA